MLVKVVPIKRLPHSKTSFDYIADRKISGHIKIGQLVKIPFRKSVEFGIVRRISRESPPSYLRGRLKAIEEIVFEEALLGREQMNFLEEISNFYHAPLSFLIKTNLLPLQKRKLTKIQDSINKIKKHADRQFHRPDVFIYSTEEEKRNYFEKNWPAKGQVLVLVPEVQQLKKIIQQLPANTQKKAVIITGELSDKEMFDVWLKIRNDPQAIVVGTRRALFLPWNNLTAILMDDEGNPNYKSWDMSPRIHTRDAATMLAQQHAAGFHLLAHTPSIETYYFICNNVYNPRSVKIKPFRERPFRLIDLKQERRGKNYSLLNDDLISDISAPNSGDVFLFINRRGDAGFVFCRDCGFTLKCPHCHRPLTYYKKEEYINCHYCRLKQNMPANCEKCGNINLTFIGVGTAGIESELKKISAFKKFKIIRLDSGSDVSTKQLNDNQPKIIVGTEYAWGRINWSRIKVMSFLDTDLSLMVPEYKASENLWQTLRSAQYRLAIDTKIHIQTNYPEHPVFQALYEPEKFYQDQLKERKIFQYPPYNFLLKLFYGGASAPVAAAAGQKMCGKLKDLTKNKKEVKIICSLEAVPHFYRRRYWQIILVKINYKHYKQNTKLILKELPDEWKVDPNPNSLLSLD